MKTRTQPTHRLAFAVLTIWLSRFLGASALTPARNSDKDALIRLLIALELTRDRSIYMLVFNGEIKKLRTEIDGSSINTAESCRQFNHIVAR